MPARLPRFRACLLAAATAVSVLAVPFATADTSAPAAAPAVPAGLPDGVPPAATRPEPALPNAAGWPFSDAFPRTSGTGRLVDGALLWSDFLYDDHGAMGLPHDRAVAGLAPSFGSYTYAAPTARGNGADVFRTAVALDDDASYWRVDWNTLVDPALPVAQWALDAGGGANRAWPGGSGVKSPWTASLLVSSKGAWLSTGGSAVRVADTVVDRASRSFVARIPRSALAVAGTSTLRMVAGLASADGAGFAALSYLQTGYQGAPNVYNIGIRPESTEPTANAFWRESAQAQALAAGGDISSFSTRVDWTQLAAHVTTPEPLVRGTSNRWFVSSYEDPRQGVVPDPNNNVQDLRPNFLGRVQPYTVYVPRSYDPAKPAPLTWLLHSLGVQHNQYAALNPKLLQQACEAQGAVCLTTLGRGPDGWYLDEAELDFWEVWNRAAAAFTLDPERTVLAGYSMGGYATYRLGLTYPDLFAKAVALAAPPMCGVRVSGSLQYASAPGRCTTDGDSSPLVGNARSLPYVMAHGPFDELVPVTSAKEQVDRFDAAGLRYRFELYPTSDHLAWAAEDLFSSPASRMNGTRTRNPGHISYTWLPHARNDALGVGTTGAYWVRDIAARTSTPGAKASFDALSAALPEPAVTPVRTTEPIVAADPAAGIAQELTWAYGAAPARAAAVSLTLVNTKALSVDVTRAGLQPDERSTVTVTKTDGPSALTLIAVRPGTTVLVDGSPVGTVGPAGAYTVPAVATGTVVTLVPQAPTQLTLQLPATVRTTDDLPVAALLTADGAPLAGRPVSLTVGDVTVDAVTGSDGVALATVPVTTAPGELPVRAAFAGSDTETASSAAGAVEVLRELTVLRWTAATRQQGSVVHAQAVLIEDDGPSLAGRTVTFQIGPTAVNAVTDATGTARAEVPAADHGRSQTVTLSFAGDDRDEPAQATTSVSWGG